VASIGAARRAAHQILRFRHTQDEIQVGTYELNAFRPLGIAPFVVAGRNVHFSYYIFLSLIAGVLAGGLFFKLWLIMRWTDRLHATHGDRYSRSILFRMMFREQSKETMDSQLWRDFEDIQRWNVLSNFIIVGIGMMTFLAILIIARIFPVG
jgi:hypothetical protein